MVNQRACLPVVDVTELYYSGEDLCLIFNCALRLNFECAFIENEYVPVKNLYSNLALSLITGNKKHHQRSEKLQCKTVVLLFL